jgi:NAD(P)-dependent dehydrogenase (short-subunit alcohol dehydrogenase family)
MTEGISRISRGPVQERLAGKVVLVTGAGGGQGQTVALLFARAGATVIASDINPMGIETTANLAAAENLSIELSVVDAADLPGVKRWVDTAADRHGGIDVVYNNGAQTRFAPFAEMTLQQWHETLRFELDVVFLPSQAAWPHLIARGGGSIINIASVSGMRGTELVGAAAHAAGKSGVIGFTRQLALEGAPHWIRANSISPGPIVTPASTAMSEVSAEFRQTFAGWPILNRVGHALDIAYAGLFLASEESTFVTGVNFAIDGGWSCKGGFTEHK